MKFIFFGSSKEINLLTQGFDKKSYLIIDDVESTVAKAKEGECLVFINFDFNAEQANKLHEQLKEIKNIKRIVYSKARDLKKENISADEYIIGPLNKVSFQNAFGEVMGGKTLSSFTLGTKGLDSDVNKNIQDAFDDAFSEDKPEAAAPEAAAPEAAAPVETSSSSDSIKDEESNLEFSVGGMEMPSQAEAPAPTPPAAESVAVPEAVESPGMTLDDGSGPASTSEAEVGLGDLEIPSMGEEMPGLELGGAEDTPAAAPLDQGLDLDLDKAATATAPAVSEPVQQETPTPPKPPAELPGALSDPSMEFTAVMAGDEKAEHESREFKFTVPHSQSESKPKEVLEETPIQAPKESDVEVQSIPSRAGDQSAIKLEAIIRALRDEREALLKEVQDNKESKSRLLGENLNLEANAEELKVELAIIKRKNEEEFHEGAYGKKLLGEKLRLAEEKNRLLQKDLEILGQKEKIDMNKILQKEKELEGQLELLSIDSQNQILIREKKISELKREADAMEFNMTNLVAREKKLRQEKLEVEEKLNKIMRTMRNSIEFLEEEIQGNQKLFKELKK